MDWRPLFCGLCFGIYPILVSRSKLPWTAMYFCFGFMGLVFAVVPFIQSGGTIISRDTPLHQILLALAGASASAVGVIWMFRYLAEAPIEKAGTLVIMMVVTQVVVTWVTAAFFARALPSGQQVLGVAFAISAIFLLSPK